MKHICVTTKITINTRFAIWLVLSLSIFPWQPVRGQSDSSVVLQNNQASKPESIKGVQIVLLGTAGGPLLQKERSEPSTLVIVGGHCYMIDCGIGTTRRLVEAGIPSQSIKKIFFTHLHPDHALGLAALMSNDFYSMPLEKVSNKIDIYGPPETTKLVKDAFEYLSIPYGIFAAEDHRRMTSPFIPHEFRHNGLIYQDNEIRVTAVENTHYILTAPKYRNKMKSYSYRFETPYGVIVFTGDTGPSDSVTKLARGADVLVSGVLDSNIVQFINRLVPAKSTDFLKEHMKFELLSPKAVGEMASSAKVKAVLLLHFGKASHVKRIVADVREYYSGPVFAGTDLQRYYLNTKTDTRLHIESEK